MNYRLDESVSEPSADDVQCDVPTPVVEDNSAATGDDGLVCSEEPTGDVPSVSEASIDKALPVPSDVTSVSSRPKRMTRKPAWMVDYVEE